MCCEVETCCCCFDHRSGVIALGAVSAILFVIGLIGGVVQVENQRKIIVDCSEGPAQTASPLGKYYSRTSIKRHSI